MDRFNYLLPRESIAQHPVEPRSSARMLVSLNRGEPYSHQLVSDLPEFIRPGDLIVVNETRVIPARLKLKKESGGAVELFLLEPDADVGSESNPESLSNGGVPPAGPIGGTLRWIALVRPGRRVPPGTVLFHDGEPVAEVTARVPGDDGKMIVKLRDSEVPTRLGVVPLPPYIESPLVDAERYQTVYSNTPGSVAAPTAGLHLTADLLGKCRDAGAEIEKVNLVIGLDTFRPVTADRPEDHKIHTEAYEVPPSTWEAAENANRVIAIGTTSVRALESAAATGALSGRTSLFIHGDFKFNIVDVLLTNYHLPRSSLLLLVDSFYGGSWDQLYDDALRSGYRFLSFGDSMLIGRGAGRLAAKQGSFSQ